MPSAQPAAYIEIGKAKLSAERQLWHRGAQRERLERTHICSKVLRSKIANGNVKRKRTVVASDECMGACVFVGGFVAVVVLERAHVNGWMGGKNKFDNCTARTNEMNKTKLKRHCCCLCCRLTYMSTQLPACLMDFLFFFFFKGNVSLRRAKI